MNLTYSSVRFIWKAVDWIYPPVCAGCGKIGFRFCSQCLSQVKIFHTDYCFSCGSPVATNTKLCPNCQNEKVICTDMASWAEFEGLLRDGIHSLKYHQNLGLGDFFAPYLISIVENRQWDPDVVIPVPISKSRRKNRGYNQSELLSRPLSRYFRLPYYTDALIRVKDTESQIQLSAEERFRNMDDAFFANPAKLKGRKILVIDDIITTGATMNQCAKALFSAGAEKVYGLSIAKTLRKRT